MCLYENVLERKPLRFLSHCLFRTYLFSAAQQGQRTPQIPLCSEKLFTNLKSKHAAGVSSLLLLSPLETIVDLEQIIGLF